MSEKEVKHTIVKTNQNSFEFGPAKKRHKIYYQDGSDLQQKIREVRLAVEEEKENIEYLSGGE